MRALRRTVPGRRTVLPACGEDQLFSGAEAVSSARPVAAGGLSEAAAAQGVGWLKPRTDYAPDAATDAAPSAGEVRPSGRRPLAIAVLGVVAALAVLSFSALWGIDRYDGMRDRAGRQRTYETTVAQLRAALDRDDLAGAGRAFASLDAMQVGTPVALALRQDLDQRMLAQAQRRDRFSNAAQSASRSLGFGEASAASAAVVPPPSSPVVPQDGCNDALAALALCQPR